MKTHARLALALLVLGACDRPETLAPDPSGELLAAPRPAYATLVTDVTHLALADLPNVTLAAAGAAAINANGWLAGSTQGVYDGESFTRQRATVWTPGGPIDLGTLPPGSGFAWANDINDANVVVGVARGANVNGVCCVLRGFAWSEATGMQALPLLAAHATASAQAHAINAAGQVAGEATDAAGATRAVTWSAQDQAPVPIPGLTAPSRAADINDAGQVAGVHAGGAFLWSPATGVQPLGDLGGGYAVAYAVNAAGHVVGYSPNADGMQRAFLWTPADGMQDLGLPAGAEQAEARDIDDAGRIIVNTTALSPETGDIVQRTFLYVQGTWIELGTAELGAPFATAINQQLQIAGGAFTGGSNRAVRWQVTLTDAPATTFEGFFEPVANLPASNGARAGQGIPLKFSLGGDLGLDIFAPGYPASLAMPCHGDGAAGTIEGTSAAGGSALSYDATTAQYTWVWKTDRSWAGTCRRVVVRLHDGTERAADFHFKP